MGGKVPPPKQIDEAKIQSSTKFYWHNVECPVVTNRELRTPLDGGSTRHIEVDITGSGVEVSQSLVVRLRANGKPLTFFVIVSYLPTYIPSLTV